ncbi:hypothetical protein CICLE_v10033851mg [Citrus x clementina]|uniref:Cytochrome P450 n=1 Tax=Citrus clementina TaxID=85681 RepID=V4TBL6_CITCL|nr:cytochrome P450 89A2 [Citrus x clementina]ESR50632.1 hypothetical protein CICLE_v10033851mg [Citrus x clementina]
METWFIILISLCISALIKAVINLLYPSKNFNYKLPPGPLNFPIITNFLLTRKSSADLESTIRALHDKFGPIITLHIGSRPAIFISDRSLAHQALIQNGAVFSDRPPAGAVAKVTSSKQHSINSASYGPTWRLLRRNLTSEILHPSRVKSYLHARKWVLQILFDGLNSQPKNYVVDKVIDHFQFAMFCLLVLMCFGDKLDEKKIREVEDVQRMFLLNIRRFDVLNFWPSVTKFVFRKLWAEFFEIRKKQEGVLLPLIRDRRKMKEERLSKAKEDEEYVLAYVDTLFDLQLPEEKRKLQENEIMSLCSEFLSAGTDTTSTVLQWVIANLVKYPDIQDKVFKEIKEVVGDEEIREVTEDDLQKLPYLKAVILESLRRHPPAHFVAPHAVKQDMVFDGFLFPQNASINFMVAEMGWDSKVWDDPMSFKPERFLNGEENRGEVFDLTGSREIKMMPFGVGRRICPGLGLAMLHSEYFVANLIWSYEWKAVDGDEVDLEERQEFTMVMKTPLKAHIYPRSK